MPSQEQRDIQGIGDDREVALALQVLGYLGNRRTRVQDDGITVTDKRRGFATNRALALHVLGVLQAETPNLVGYALEERTAVLAYDQAILLQTVQVLPDRWF